MIIEIDGVELRQYRESQFYISKDGDVYSLYCNRYIRPYNTGQYLCFKTPDGKNKKVHKAVAECWVINNNQRDFHIIDHINRDKLDNRSENLRWVSSSINNHNKPKKTTGASSRYKGVSWDNSRNKWIAGISMNGRRIRIGSFECEHEAGQAYNNYAMMLLDDHAVLNDIPDME